MTQNEITPEFKQQMNDLAGALDRIFNGDTRPKQTGFALLVFEFNNSSNSRINYISNAQREDMLTAMKEFIARAEGRVVDVDTVQ